MQQITLKRGFIREPNPWVVAPHSIVQNAEMKFDTKQLHGEHWIRVFPENAADVFTIQCLVHRVEKHAPASGQGVIVDARCLDMEL